MAYSVEKVGKTVDEAIKLALDELKIDKSLANIVVIDEGNKGLFGLFGNKFAKVQVTKKYYKSDMAKDFLSDVFNKMKIEVEIKVDEDENLLMISITGQESGIIIGRRGETLDSLQYLTSLVINKGKDSYKRVVVDIENYRKKREDTLIRLANNLADRVITTKKNITLEPMNPYERRIIHSSLQNNKYVNTFSVGDEPNRKIVITLK